VPPRYAYWTILIDNRPTAFRAASRDELQPTLFQLRRTNADVTLKWFARGRLWESPEAERDEQRKARSRARPQRDERRRVTGPRERRPAAGGAFKRARFKPTGSRKPRRG